MGAGRFHNTESRQKWPPANCSFKHLSQPKGKNLSHLPTGVLPPYSIAEQHFLYILTYKQVRSSENKLYSAAEGNSSPHFLFPVPKLSRDFILTVPWSVNGKSLLSTSRLVSAAHTHCTQQKFQSIRQVGPRRWKGRKETYKQ